MTPDKTQSPHKFRRPILRAANLMKLRDRSLYPLIVSFCLFLLPIILGLFGWSFYERINKPKQVFYAVNNENFIPLRALSYPNLSTPSVLKWAVEAASAAYTLNFNDYNQVLQSVRHYFTQAGYDNFLQALRNENVLQTIQQKKLIVSGVATDTPIILREGMTSEGFYAWQIQFPMLISYQSGSDEVQQNIVLTLLIIQVPTTESPKGIGIASFSVQSRSGGPL